MLYRMYDAAYPSINPPPWSVAAGYIGGNTPHVWTKADWGAQRAPYRLPIWVRSTGGDPRRDADAAISTCEVLGVPKGCTVALDLETRIDPGFVDTFDQELLAEDYLTMAYGSLSTIFDNPDTSGGRWVASWTGVAEQHSGALATQYASDRMLGTDYDASVIDSSVRLWTVTDWSDQIMNQLPVLAKGFTGFPVNNLQAMLNDSWAIQGDVQLKVDKVFGPATEARVRQEQQRKGLTPDGVVGPKTWNLLLLDKL